MTRELIRGACYSFFGRRTQSLTALSKQGRRWWWRRRASHDDCRTRDASGAAAAATVARHGYLRRHLRRETTEGARGARNNAHASHAVSGYGAGHWITLIASNVVTGQCLCLLDVALVKYTWIDLRVCSTLDAVSGVAPHSTVNERLVRVS